jgi:GAF domain-containing protein
VTGRSVIDCRAVHVHDLLACDEFPEGQEVAQRFGVRSILSTPLVRDNVAVGAIMIRRAEVRPFSEKQVALLQTFADQAMIAMENVRLFHQVEARTRDLQESLEYQTATSDVLNVISRSPSQIQPVLDSIVETARRLCEAFDAIIFPREGEWLKVAAHRGPIPVDFDKWPIGRGWLAGRSVVDLEPVQVDDLLAAGDEFPDGQSMASRFGHRTTLAIPLIRENQAIGSIVIRRTQVRPFSDKQIALLHTFADQAVIAIENVRLFEEVQERTTQLSDALEQQTATAAELRALSEVIRAVNSSLDLEKVLSTIVKNAVQLSRTDAGAIYVYSNLRKKFRLRATYGMSDEFVEAMRSQTVRLGETVLGEAAAPDPRPGRRGESPRPRARPEGRLP